MSASARRRLLQAVPRRAPRARGPSCLHRALPARWQRRECGLPVRIGRQDERTKQQAEAPDGADSDGSYEVSVLVSGGVNSDTADVVVTLGNEIELRTTINGPTAVSFAGNGATRVATFTASSDDDRDGVEWIISGSDAQYFTIDTPSGALRFHIDPVSPTSSRSCQTSRIRTTAAWTTATQSRLQASAGSATTSSLAVTVTVGDVDEAGAISLSTARPGMGSKLTATLTDPDEVVLSDLRAPGQAGRGVPSTAAPMPPASLRSMTASELGRAVVARLAECAHPVGDERGSIGGAHRRRHRTVRRQRTSRTPAWGSTAA